MKKLIILFITIISLSSCFNKDIEKAQTGSTETNTGEIEEKIEKYGNVEIVGFPANQIEKLDKLPYSILSDKEPTCKEGEQKVNFRKANMTYCISKEYMGCNNMGCMTFTKDDSGKYYTQNDISESSDIIKPDDLEGHSKISGIYLYPKENRKLIRVYEDENFYSKVYNFGEFFIIDIFEKNNNSYYKSNLYIIKNNHYLANIKYKKENPNVKRLLETLYIPEQN
ncbi:hypothetical protein BLD25_02215 [Candidatus Gracilibacteria bacterium GN02-872]|nr:hypothetical protein BLD25_02215 [Candidatus Gracilibacteria bacterium GN02-872]